jgi:nitric oxide reductase NorQ protein
VLNEKDSEVIERHKYGYMIISMNPATAEFSGTKPLNAAMRRRMAVWINFDFLSVGEKISPDEVDMLRKRTKIDQDIAYKIIQAGAELSKASVNVGSTKTSDGSLTLAGHQIFPSP